MIICVDFDGTCVSHEFPKVGKEIGAATVLKMLVEAGHKLVLFTMRDNVANPTTTDPTITAVPGNYLDDAVNWFRQNRIPLYGINTNPEQKSWTNSPKAYGELYIDDAALGCPLKMDRSISERPFVDWRRVRSILYDRGLL